MDESYFLLVVLRAELAVSLTTADIDQVESIVIDGAEYMDMGYADFAGFTDWLRDSSGRVLGVRLSPFEDLEFLFDVVKSLGYVDLDRGSKYFNIYFSDERLYDEARSDDQAFGGNKVYASEGGEYLLTFNAAGVKEAFTNGGVLYSATLRASSPKLKGQV